MAASSPSACPLTRPPSPPWQSQGQAFLGFQSDLQTIGGDSFEDNALVLLEAKEPLLGVGAPVRPPVEQEEEISDSIGAS